MINQPEQLTDKLVRDAVQAWNTSIVESSNDFDRMKSTLTAIMPQLMQEPDIETAALAAERKNELKQNRRYKKLMRRCSQLNNALIKASTTKPADVAAVRRQALEALKKSEQFIENGVELGFIRLPDIDDPALETLPTIQEAIRALSAEPAQGEQWRDTRHGALCDRIVGKIRSGEPITDQDASDLLDTIAAIRLHRPAAPTPEASS